MSIFGNFYIMAAGIYLLYMIWSTMRSEIAIIVYRARRLAIEVESSIASLQMVQSIRLMAWQH
jgi:hypothetical protein